MFPIRRDRNAKRAAKVTRTYNPSTEVVWSPKLASNQRNIGGSAVRTEGNPWGDSDGGKGHIADMASDAWKGAGY